MVRLEPELVGNLGEGIPGVVDMDLIEDIIAKLIEVWPAVGGLQGDIVADQGDGTWLVRADKGVQIGAVGHRVLGDFGCFTMR